MFLHFGNDLHIHKEQAGVLVGSGFGGARVFSDGVESLNMRDYHKISPFLTPFVMPNMGSALLDIDLGFSGPNYSILAACTSSNYFFCAAASHIREGKADLMIAGGVEASIIPIIMGGFAACRALSRRNDDLRSASRPWDKDRDGFVMGEGAGVLVMERGSSQIYLATKSYCKVNYINAHATSTQVGDLAEVHTGLGKWCQTKVLLPQLCLYRCDPLFLLVNCMGAVGSVEAIATIKAIQTGWEPEPAVDFDIVANKKPKHEINVAISNSFGIGGHNSVVAFSAFKP
ncbi:3-oxoacyl-[acyl-carrier-protein] synthase I, chloroplastic-like protein [Tanacetum coccineum]